MQLKSFEQLCHYVTNICLKDPIKSALVFQLLTFGDYEKTARNRVEKLRAGSAHVLFRPLIPHFSGYLYILVSPKTRKLIAVTSTFQHFSFKKSISIQASFFSFYIFRFFHLYFPQKSDIWSWLCLDSGESQFFISSSYYIFFSEILPLCLVS